MKRLLLALFPGAERWLWRRICCVGSTVTLQYCIVVATLRGDAPSIGQLVIGLGVTLGAFVGGSVTDDHLKRKAEAEKP